MENNMDGKGIGRVILKSVPTKTAEEQVVNYLKKIFKKTSHEKIIQKIRKTPTPLIKEVPAEAGKRVAADLIRLGAVAVFEPFVNESTKASLSQEPKVHNVSIISNNAMDDQSPGAPVEILRSKWVKLSAVFMGVALLSCLLFYFLSYRPSANDKNDSGRHEISRSSKSQVKVPAADKDTKEPDFNKRAPSRVAKDVVRVQEGITKVGIYIDSSHTPGLGDLSYAKGQSELLAKSLKDDSSLNFVNRKKIAHHVKMNGLMLKQLLNPVVAAKVGKSVGADVLIIGQLIHKEDQGNQYKENSVAVKAINVKSATTIDIGCFQMLPNMSYRTHVDQMAQFVKTVTLPGTSLSQRRFVALDMPSDQTLSNSTSHLRAKVQKYIQKEFGSRPHVCVVKQSHLKYFFTTLNLSDKGLLQDSDSNNVEQPFYTIVGWDLMDQSRDNIPFALKLKVEFLGHGDQFAELKARTWKEGIKRLGVEIDVLLRAKTDQQKQMRLREAKLRGCVDLGPRCEAKEHFERGKKLSNLRISSWPPYLNVTLYENERDFYISELGGGARSPDGKRQELSTERKLKNIREAINAFESTLFLDPENHEAMLFLAICLAHPDIGEGERSRDLLYQVVKNAADEKLKYNAGNALGIVDTIKFSDAFAKKLFTPEYHAQKYSYKAYKLLWPDGKQAAWWEFGPEEMNHIFKAIDKSIYAHCENVKWRRGQDRDYDLKHAVYQASSAMKDLTWSVNRNNKIAAHLKKVLSVIGEKYPELLPNLVADFDIKSSVHLLEAFLNSIEPVQSGEVTPLLPEKFDDSLYGHLIECAVSEKKEYCEAGVKIANLMASLRSGPFQHNMYLAFCYKGMGQLDKALALLEKIEGANNPKIKTAFLEQSPLTFRKTLGDAQRSKYTGHAQKTARKSQRALEPVARVASDREIHAMALDGDTVWLCANKRQDPIAPNGLFEPVIYGYRKGMEAPIVHQLPVKIIGMATAIIAAYNRLWVGTDEGLLEFHPDRKDYRHINESDGLLKPNINSLSLVGSKLYIGLGSGVGYYDIERRHFTGVMNTNDVVKIAATVDGLWVMTKSDGLHFISGKTNKDEFQTAWNCPNAFSMAADENRVVIGKNLQLGRFFGMRDVGSAGLVIYDRKRDRRFAIPDIHFAGQDVLSLAFARDLLWVGGRGFLAVVDIEKRKVVQQTAGRGARFHALLSDNGGGMWVAQGSKLYHLGYDPKKSSQ